MEVQVLPVVAQGLPELVVVVLMLKTQVPVVEVLQEQQGPVVQVLQEQQVPVVEVLQERPVPVAQGELQMPGVVNPQKFLLHYWWDCHSLRRILHYRGAVFRI